MFAIAKTKTQISFAVTAKLISAYVFATQIVQSLYLLNSKFQASSSVLWLYSPVCLGAGQNQNQNQNSLLVKRQNDNTSPGDWPRKISP